MKRSFLICLFILFVFMCFGFNGIVSEKKLNILANHALNKIPVFSQETIEPIIIADILVIEPRVAEENHLSFPEGTLLILVFNIVDEDYVDTYGINGFFLVANNFLVEGQLKEKYIKYKTVNGKYNSSVYLREHNYGKSLMCRVYFGEPIYLLNKMIDKDFSYKLTIDLEVEEQRIKDTYQIP